MRWIESEGVWHKVRKTVRRPHLLFLLAQETFCGKEIKGRTCEEPSGEACEKCENEATS